MVRTAPPHWGGGRWPVAMAARRLRQHPGRKLPPWASHPEGPEPRHGAGGGFQSRQRGSRTRKLSCSAVPLACGPSLTVPDAARKPRRPQHASHGVGEGPTERGPREREAPHHCGGAACVALNSLFPCACFSSSLGEKLPGAPAVHLQQSALRPAARGVQLAEELQDCKQALLEPGDWTASVGCSLSVDGLYPLRARVPATVGD